MKMYTRRVFKVFLCVFIFLLASVYCAQRSNEKKEIESIWRHFLVALSTGDFEKAYTYIDNHEEIDTFDKFLKSRWVDLSHPWYLTVEHKSVQLVTVRPNIMLTRSTLVSSTSTTAHFWWFSDGLHTEVTMIKRGTGWRVSGLPYVVAN